MQDLLDRSRVNTRPLLGAWYRASTASILGCVSILGRCRRCSRSGSSELRGLDAAGPTPRRDENSQTASTSIASWVRTLTVAMRPARRPVGRPSVISLPWQPPASSSGPGASGRADEVQTASSGDVPANSLSLKQGSTGFLNPPERPFLQTSVYRVTSTGPTPIQARPPRQERDRE